MKGHRMMPMTKPMPRPIHWKTRVKKFTIGSSIPASPWFPGLYGMV
jgi:hypothetical protein